MHELGRAEQIGQSEGLIAELQLSENQSHISNVAITQEFVDMCDTHETLKDLMQESANLEAIKGSVIPPYLAARALSKSLGDLYNVVEVFARIGETDFVTTLDLFNETLKKMRPFLKSKSDDIILEAE